MSKSRYSRGICLGYILSVVDTHKTFNVVTKTPKYFCIPRKVTSGQVQQVTIKYFKDHPEILHNSASSAVLEALNDAFPCK